ncbi:Oidioi.mRNA.OKI2018_I69.PAR.g13165.t1.cds [Oikopleura dioica]|uniref:Oidioi.mRNA.OKI2018_I69.PAR.g13165.t1.cds n=1 Tax=Oikopleura dioica TaxID=34765 RepID=A0ABN7S8R6_OIKDI|nr:Oidioi.mRNA.OKI2018_I69.PAR.g13165.t1.cds [Oikopleura dioica]
MISSSQIEETEEEARNLEMLSGGNQFIVQFVDFLPMERPDWFKLTSISFLVMEFCELGSLNDWIGRRKQQGRWTSAEEVSLIGAQIISALAFCHSRDIAHLDVKPQNVFIKGDGITIRVGDFGSVMQLRSIEATIQGTSTDAIKNTLIYTPPESFTEPLRRSARLDVWGFGHIIQELLTFEHAFCRVDGRPTRNQRQIVNNICENKRTKLSQIRSESEEFIDFEILLQKCLNPQKLLRLENALQLRGEAIFCEFLERIESGEAPNEIIAPPEEIIRRLRETNQQQESLIEGQKRRISELEGQNRKFLAEITKQKQKVAEQEEDLKNILAENERKNQIEENLKIENGNQKKEIADLKRELDEFKDQRQSAANERQQGGECDLRRVASPIVQPFASWQKLEVAENGWNLKFQGGGGYGRDDGHLLWIGNKDGGVRFKAVVQEIDYENGKELSRGEIRSEPDGQKQKIKYNTIQGYFGDCFVRYNITFSVKSTM